MPSIETLLGPVPNRHRVSFANLPEFFSGVKNSRKENNDNNEIVSSVPVAEVVTNNENNTFGKKSLESFIQNNNEILSSKLYNELKVGKKYYVFDSDRNISKEFELLMKSKKSVSFFDTIGKSEVVNIDKNNIGKEFKIYLLDDVLNKFNESEINNIQQTENNEEYDYDFYMPIDDDFAKDLQFMVADSLNIEGKYIDNVNMSSVGNKLFVDFSLLNPSNKKEEKFNLEFGVDSDGKKIIVNKINKANDEFVSRLENEINDYILDGKIVNKMLIKGDKIYTLEG